MNLIIEFGLMAALTVANSPHGKQSFQVPYLLVEKRVYEDFYFKSVNSSRTEMARLNHMNPKNMKWEIAFGYKTKFQDGVLDLSLGHISQHEVNAVDSLTESHDFIKVSYRLEYK